MQQLYQLEVSCGVDRDGNCWTNGKLNTDNGILNPAAIEFRPKRNARAIAELKIIDVTQEGNEPPQVEWLKDIDNTTGNKRFHEHIFSSYNWIGGECRDSRILFLTIWKSGQCK